MKLGLLDFGEVYKGSNSIEVIHNTISNCQLAEEKGFSRFWLAEHYSNSVAWRNAEIILTLLAGYTEKIKVGAAGVKLNVHHSSFHVAQHYRALATMFEDRIDLGIAKGFETQEIIDVIMDSESSMKLEDKVLKIVKLFNNEYEALSLVPNVDVNPDIWMLSTSESMHNFCIENKLNLAISLFHKLSGPHPHKDIIKRLRDDFHAKNGFVPDVNIAISVFCNDSQERIKNEIDCRENVALNVSGTPEQCKEQINELVELYDVEEAILLNLGRDHEEKAFLIENIMN